MNSEEKRTTIMMIERAKRGESLEQMLKEIKQSRTLPQILLPRMKDMSNEVLADLAGCSRAYVYGIMNGTKHPGKDLLLRIAFVLGMSVDEAQEMLKTAHRAQLSSKDHRDVCIIFGLVHGLDLETMDEVLLEQDQKPLSAIEKEEEKLLDVISYHLEKRKMTELQLLEKIHCDPETFQEILEEAQFAPRDLLLRAGIILKMDLAEVQVILKMEKKPALSVKDERDMYIMNGISNKMKPDDLNQKLLEHDMEPLWK